MNSATSILVSKASTNKETLIDPVVKSNFKASRETDNAECSSNKKTGLLALHYS